MNALASDMRSALGWAAGFGLALLLGACFSGAFAHGLACTRDDDCGPTLACIAGLCGGPGEPALCGNGLLEGEEACDDGNTVNGDGCSENCDYCGDGSLQDGEACDDGNTQAGDLCTPTCRFPVCGDGFLAPGEACDDGNDVGNDGCTPSCTLPTCGDGFVTEDEACDDGNVVETDECTTACTLSPEAPALVLTLAQVKQFEFTWAPALGAAYYRLFEWADADADRVQVGGDITGTATALTVPLYFRPDAGYVLAACNDLGRCIDSQGVDVAGDLGAAVGYFKAPNTDLQDSFGFAVALADDGNTLAVGALAEDSAAIGDEDDDSLVNSGAVYVYTRPGPGEEWSYTYLKPGDPLELGSFGSGVALAGDGDTLAVHGAYNSPTYVFVRDPETRAWTEQLRVEVAATAVALAQDGDTLALGDKFDDDIADGSGATHVYVRENGSWTLEDKLTAANAGAVDGFGASVALSANGDALVVGAPNEKSGSLDESNDEASEAGAVYVFERGSGVWEQRAYLKASNPGVRDVFGWSVALSHDGAVLAVGAPGEDSGATGIDGDQGDDFPNSIYQEGAGAAYVFVRGDGGSWSQQAYVKASNTGDLDLFGIDVALSGDGRVLAVSSSREDSLSTGIDGAQNDLLLDGGAVYVYMHVDGRWSERPAFVKAPQPIRSFGAALALNGDGGTLAVGAPYEASAATQVGGNQADDSLEEAGAVYLY